MPENDDFPELNLNRIRSFTTGWVGKYPCIETIILCRAGTSFSYDPSDPDNVKYVLVVNVPPNPFLTQPNRDDETVTFSFTYQDLEFSIKARENQVVVAENFGVDKYKKDPEIISTRLVMKSLISDQASKTAIGELNAFIHNAVKQYPELKSILKYHKWAKTGPCDHIFKEIPLFYNTDKISSCSQRKKNWLWYDIAPGEEPSSLNDDVNDYVVSPGEAILYPITEAVMSSNLDSSCNSDIGFVFRSGDPEEQLDEFLVAIKPDIQRFYESLKTVLKRHSKDELPDYTRIAQEAFEEQSPFQWLDPKDFGDVFDCSFNVETKYKVVPGKLAKNMISRISLELSKIEPKSGDLYKRMNKLP